MILTCKQFGKHCSSCKTAINNPTTTHYKWDIHVDGMYQKQEVVEQRNLGEMMRPDKPLITIHLHVGT